jgi:hypothetical protein
MFERNSSLIPAPKTTPLSLQALDDRIVPATWNIASGDVNGLIAAIRVANTNNERDVINLAPNGVYDLTTAFTTGTGLPPITLDRTLANSITISGNGATIRRSSAAGVADFRIFSIEGGALNLNEVTLTNGKSRSGTMGGAISITAGSLLLTNSTLSGNIGLNGGGAIYVGSRVTEVILRNTTVSGNRTTASGSLGGGLLIEGGSTTAVRLINTTVAFNTSMSNGGGIHVRSGSLNLLNTIVSDNTASTSATSAFDLFRSGGSISAQNSLTKRAPASGTINGTNINNKLGADPKLGALANNGGKTRTHALGAGSAAINAGNNAFSPSSIDQRGQARIVGGTIDMGAVESSSSTAVTPPPPSNTTPPTPPPPTQSLPTQPTTPTGQVRPPIMALEVSPRSPVNGQSLTLSVSIIPEIGRVLPSGTVNFYINGVYYGTFRLVNDILASIQIPSLAPGTYTVRAVYTPDAGNLISAGSVQSKLVVADKNGGIRWER